MYCVASCGRGGRRAAVPRALITDGRTITPGDKKLKGSWFKISEATMCS